jgi:hypothetical protein
MDGNESNAPVANMYTVRTLRELPPASYQLIANPFPVTWSWGGSNPSGIAAEVKPGEVTVVSHRGNEISKTGTEDNPAVHIERPGNDVVKAADELNVAQKASTSSETNGTTNGTSEPQKEEKKDVQKEEQNPEEPKPEEKKPEGDEPQVGDKRKADEKADADQEKDEKAEEEDAKKQKTTNGDAVPAPAANGEKKKPGRPKSGSGGGKAKKEKKAPAVGRAERRTRSQGAA